ncbi:hypothetical protein GMOD_00003889 [Pyrenophora seminiperda CCB06]|uniref:Uncharacterized protein n=1 Tax=Pyrenophora seminiperda CCB06 TaxID=1302712 RepID=A0A3M7M069_9PLEO|nr:hypothetical protein GMOD_00003889 [Pyrenophora seminiperda CCB06]
MQDHSAPLSAFWRYLGWFYLALRYRPCDISILSASCWSGNGALFLMAASPPTGPPCICCCRCC